MKSIRYPEWSILTIVVVVVVHLVGCSTFSPPPVETLSSTSLSSTITSPSNLESPTVSYLVSPTRTLTPVPTPTSRPTPIPTLHHTPRPTLTTTEKYSYVQEMLGTNAGCELPCWWGIIPGESDLQDANDRLLYNIYQFPQDLGGYEVFFSLSEESDLVQSLNVEGYCFPDNCGPFARDWARYSLDQVLSRYGTPSQVRITLALPIDSGGPTYYELYILYDNLGVGIHYKGPAVRQAELLHTCFSFSHITLWLQSPESSTSLEQTVGPEEWFFHVPLEEATGMDIEEFYETFQHTGACLEAPPTFP